MLSVSGYRGVEVKEYESDHLKRNAEELETYLVVRPGELVLNTMWLNHCGLGISREEGIVSPAYRVYRIDQRAIDLRFCHHLLRSESYVDEYTRLAYGIRPNSLQVSADDFGLLPIPLPSLAEQRAIAAFLDRKTAAIDSLIAKKGRLIELLQEKRQALITQMVTKGLDPNVPMKDSGERELGWIPFGWTVGQIGRFIKLQRGIDITGANDVESGFPVISSGGYSGYSPRAMAKGPGVVIGRKGTLGTVFLVLSDYWPHDTTLWVREFRGSHPRFVFYFLRHLQLERLDTGAANPTLNRNLVHPIKVAWPEVQSQRMIAEYLDQEITRLDTEEGQLERSLKLLREYRQALISAAVTGKIEVPAEEAA